MPARLRRRAAGRRGGPAGRPFVGPAGQLFDRALAEAGIDRQEVYVTNAVKHFKFEPRGKRRIHQKPTAGEVGHCRWWLMRELELSSRSSSWRSARTAVLALTGKQIPITRARGPRFDWLDMLPRLYHRAPVLPAAAARRGAKAAAYGHSSTTCAEVEDAGARTRRLIPRGSGPSPVRWAA